MVKITEELRELAQLFYDNGEILFIVGGYVRDGYLSVENKIEKKDIDLSSAATPDKVRYILKGTKFRLEYLNAELGVLAIFGEQRYEYATFRRESYNDNTHIPNTVTFIRSLREDSERRDFKINAIYYDILKDEYVDPLGGLKDLDSRTITTTKIPRVVFNDDPERILRFIRFSNSLNLSVSDNVYFYVKENALKVQYLSRGRIRRELNKLILADKMYPEIEGVEYAHYNAFKMLEELGLLEIIFPLFSQILKSTETSLISGTKFSDYVFEHFKTVSPNLRFAVVFFDMLNQELAKNAESQKDKKKKDEANFDKDKYINDLLEENIGEQGLNYPRRDIDRVKRIISGYYYQKNIFTTAKDIRRFIFDNYEAFNGIIELKELIKLKDEKENEKNNKMIDLLKQTYNLMLEQNTLFDYTELNVTGKELIKYFPKIKLDLLDEFMVEIAGALAENAGMENNIDNIVAMGKKVISENREYFCEDEIEVATYKTDGKVKKLFKKVFRKIKKLIVNFFKKTKNMLCNLIGKGADSAKNPLPVKKVKVKKDKNKTNDVSIEEIINLENGNISEENMEVNQISDESNQQVNIDNVDTENTNTEEMVNDSVELSNNESGQEEVFENTLTETEEVYQNNETDNTEIIF